LVGDYIVITFNTTLNYNYRSIVYDKNGDVAFILSRKMSVISAYSKIMTYFDEFGKEFFLVEMK